MSQAFDDHLTRFVYALTYFNSRSGARQGSEIDLAALTDMFGLEEEDQTKKYLDKLKDLDIVDVNGGVALIKDSEKLETVLGVLSKSGKFVLKL
jgi:hypothetical protein